MGGFLATSRMLVKYMIKKCALLFYFLSLMTFHVCASGESTLVTIIPAPDPHIISPLDKLATAGLVITYIAQLGSTILALHNMSPLHWSMDKATKGITFTAAIFNAAGLA